MKAHVLLFILFLGGIVAVSAWGRNSNEKVKLTEVRAITLTKGAYTTGRRSSPVPQLNCVGGAARSKQYDIETVQCTNQGSDGYDVQWKCEADMDSDVRFGKVEVTCEGYEYPDDPYILRGSCGLEYTLEYTNQGKQNQYNNQYNQHQNSYHYDTHNTYSRHGSWFSFKSLLMLGILAFIFYNIYRQCTTMGRTGASAGAGGYPPGSNWGPGGPPPGDPYYGSGGGSGYCAPPPPTYSYWPWRPGFWTGFTTGGLLGSLFRPSYGGYSSYRSYSRPSSFSSGRSFSSSSGSSSRTSSGFGGTRRR